MIGKLENKDTLVGVINYGDRGPKGNDGREIVNVVTNADSTITLIYNDGTTITTDPLHITQSSDWADVQQKPFSTLGTGLVVEDGVLRVDTTDVVEADNTKPITSAGVNVVVGNINSLLETI